jgi:hypothetical protein
MGEAGVTFALSFADFAIEFNALALLSGFTDLCHLCMLEHN